MSSLQLIYVEHLNLHYDSGRIHMIHATLEPFLIRPKMVCQCPQLKMETRFTAVRSPISKANGYLAVHVLGNHILDLCIQMEPLWGGPHQRLIYLRRRCV